MKTPCIVPGCQTRGWIIVASDTLRHWARTHQECSCGWIGTSFNSHYAMMQRHGGLSENGAHHFLVEEYPCHPGRVNLAPAVYRAQFVLFLDREERRREKGRRA